MRLVDADKLIEYLGFENTQEEREDNAGEIITLEDIDRQPTAYDIDKVVEQLELNSKLYSLSDSDCEFAIPLNIAIEIVKAGEQE